MNKRSTYHVCNWSEYNRSLIARGSLSLWINENTINNWYANEVGNCAGFKKVYSDSCIQCALRIKSVYGLSLRAAKGFLESIITMLKLEIKVPCYTTLCRRQKKLNAALEKPAKPQDGIVLAIDSTGLKVFGEGEWKTRMHGYNYHRVWRKLHIAIDTETQQIQSLVLSTNDFKDGELLDDLLDQIEEPIDKVIADGAYDSFSNFECIEAIDAEPVVPTRSDAKISQHGNKRGKRIARDEVVRAIKKTTLKRWKQDNSYHTRSLVETAMFRFKTIFGGALSARNFDSQLAEVIEKCSILNIFTSLGMPLSVML